MASFLIPFQLLVSMLLIAAILLQQRGGGLSATFGGDGGLYHTRRGLEKVIFRATITLSILFLAAALMNVILR